MVLLRPVLAVLKPRTQYGQPTYKLVSGNDLRCLTVQLNSADRNFALPRNN